MLKEAPTENAAPAVTPPILGGTTTVGVTTTGPLAGSGFAGDVSMVGLAAASAAGSAGGLGSACRSSRGTALRASPPSPESGGGTRR